MKYYMTQTLVVLLVVGITVPIAYVQEEISDFEMFESTLVQAQEYIQSGNKEDATTSYLSLLTTSPFKSHIIISANVLAGEMWDNNEMQAAVDFYTIVVEEIGDANTAYGRLSTDVQQMLKENAQRRIYEISQTYGLTEKDDLTAARDYYLQVKEDTDVDELIRRADEFAKSLNDLEQEGRGVQTGYSYALGEYIFQLMHSGRYETARNLVKHYIDVTKSHQDAFYYEEQIMTLIWNESYDDLLANRIDGAVDSEALESIAIEMIAESDRLIEKYSKEGANVAAAYDQKVLGYSELNRQDLIVETFDEMLQVVPFTEISKYYFESTSNRVQRKVDDVRKRDRLIGDFIDKRETYLSQQVD